MTDCRLACTTGVVALLLAIQAQAQTPAAAVYRCGNTYSSTPCPDGKPVAVDDPRSDDQRQQALAASKQNAQLAKGLAAERRVRERAATGLQAARIGPSAAERAQAEALAAKEQAKRDAKKKKSSQPRKLGAD